MHCILGLDFSTLNYIFTAFSGHTAGYIIHKMFFFGNYWFIWLGWAAAMFGSSQNKKKGAMLFAAIMAGFFMSGLYMKDIISLLNTMGLGDIRFMMKNPMDYTCRYGDSLPKYIVRMISPIFRRRHISLPLSLTCESSFVTGVADTKSIAVTNTLAASPLLFKFGTGPRQRRMTLPAI